MANLVAAALGVQPQLMVEPAKRPSEVTRYIADIAKAAELLGYQPQTPLDKGIPLAVDWWKRWQRNNGALMDTPTLQPVGVAENSI